MAWDWAIDTFKGLLVAGTTWSVIYLRKQAKPFIKSLKKFAKLLELTDRLNTEVAILRSSQTAMYDIVTDPIYILNDKSEVIYANNAYAKMGGLRDPRDAYGFGYMSIIPEDDKEKIERQSKMLNEHPSAFEGIIRFQKMDTGEIIKTECRTSLFYDDNRKLIGTLGRLYIKPSAKE